ARRRGGALQHEAALEYHDTAAGGLGGVFEYAVIWSRVETRDQGPGTRDQRPETAVSLVPGPWSLFRALYRSPPARYTLANPRIHPRGPMRSRIAAAVLL